MAVKRPEKKSADDMSIEKWVENRGVVETPNTEISKPAQVKTEPEKRYTLIMSESLHQKMKIFCAQHGVSVKDFLTQAIINEMNR